MKYIYLCSGAVAKQLEFVSKNKENHNYNQTKSTTYIWPNTTNKETINPIDINAIKTDYKIRDIVILDRVRGVTTVTIASDHINRTGENYLIGNNKKMVFTDLTRLYTNQEKMITTCLGTKYEKNKKQHTLPSTDIGLIAILCRSIQPKTIIRVIYRVYKRMKL